MSWNVMDIEFQTSQTSIIKPSNGTKDRRHRPLSIPESSAIDKPDVSDVNRERPMTPRGCDGLFTRIVVGLLAKLAAPILYVPDPLFGIANDWFCGSEAQRLRAWSLVSLFDGFLCRGFQTTPSTPCSAGTGPSL